MSNTGTECVSESSLSPDNPTTGLIQWVPFVFYGVIAGVSVITWIFARKVSPRARTFIILTFGLSVIELATDCLFLLQTYALPSR